ncbi:hypothetical protein FRC04_006522 [Tulasnella sp. 424]|nr:hypothetical protein FRC04_006522 [Tulasnella sp. 424]KAG8981019.1 hypothetical protein FRC05_003919 [Tulasnella sp. 425]
MLKKLTLYMSDSESDSSAEPLQTIGLVELPHLEVFHLRMKADVAISLLQHITSTSCNQLKVAVSFEEPPRVVELRQALTGFLPCIQRAVEASSRTYLSIKLFAIKGQQVQMATDAAAPNTFTLSLSFARDWSSETFQWMGDRVAPLSHNDPFVTISLVTGGSTYIPRQFASSAPGGWTETILFMPCVRILDLGGELAPMRSFFNRLSEPIDVPGGSPRWPLASLKRLITQPHRNSPLELLQLLKARRGQGTESGHLAPPGHLAELVLRVGGRGLDKKWAEHIPAIEEALKPGLLLIQ